MVLVDGVAWEVIEEPQDERIVKFRNLINVGLTANLNKALELAEEKYIKRMDADDIAVTNRIERTVEFMEAKLDVVLSDCWM